MQPLGKSDIRYAAEKIEDVDHDLKMFDSIDAVCRRVPLAVHNGSLQ